MATNLALRTPEPTALTPAPAPRFSFDEMQAMAKSVADSRLFPGVQNAQQALTLMLLCDAEGLHPINALRRYHIIEGRPSMRADAIQAEFQAKGGTIRWDRSDEQVCIATFFHPTHAPEGETVEVRFADLSKAGITGGKEGVKKNWRQYPRQMLRARAISEGVRMVLPGVICGIYTPEEVADFAEPPPRRATARVAVAEPVELEQAPEPGPEPAPAPAPPPIRLYSEWVERRAEKMGISEYQLNNHLYKWACAAEIAGECLVPEPTPNATNADKFGAMKRIWDAHWKPIRDEARRYEGSEAVRLAVARKDRREQEAEAEVPERLPGKGDSYEGPEEEAN